MSRNPYDYRLTAKDRAKQTLERLLTSEQFSALEDYVQACLEELRSDLEDRMDKRGVYDRYY